MTVYTLAIRVYYADTDAGGVLHHAAYVRYFEQGRTEYIRSLGSSVQELLEKYGIMFAITNINISYLRPARLDDLLYLRTKIQQIRKASIIFEQELVLAAAPTEIICIATVKLASVNLKMQLCGLPDLFKTLENC